MAVRRRDSFSQYRREHLTPSEVQSPITYVKDLYRKLHNQLPELLQEQIVSDMSEFLTIIDKNPETRTSGEDVYFLYVLYSARLLYSGP
jgi:hypothetical protein